MVNITDKDLQGVEDAAIRLVLNAIIQELNRITSLPPTNEDPKVIAAMVNKITGNL